MALPIQAPLSNVSVHETETRILDRTFKKSWDPGTCGVSYFRNGPYSHISSTVSHGVVDHCKDINNPGGLIYINLGLWRACVPAGFTELIGSSYHSSAMCMAVRREQIKKRCFVTKLYSPQA